MRRGYERFPAGVGHVYTLFALYKVSKGEWYLPLALTLNALKLRFSDFSAHKESDAKKSAFEVYMKYIITLDEKQAYILGDALDFFERVLGLGQLEEVENQWRWHADFQKPDTQSRSEALRHSLYAAKAIGWNLSANASYGIRSPEIAERYRIAYDMTQVLRKAKSDEKLREAEASGDAEAARWIRMTVDQRDFWATAPEVPPITVEPVAEKPRKKRAPK